MRAAFINTLTELARSNKDIFLLTGDLGFSVFENFREEFPERFFNIGVAEANMAGIAAGLALSGKQVFVYSIVPFLTMRCFEQIRDDIACQNLNVRLVGSGGGLCYGPLGPTHHSIEDIAIMRAIPDMTVICPGDPVETESAIRCSVKYQGPVYLRLAKSREPIVHLKLDKFVIGKGITISSGSDLTIIVTGNMLCSAKHAADQLTNKKISVRLISMPTVKPIDRDIIISALRQTKAIFTIEEHALGGGLGSAVAELLAEEGIKIHFRRIALPDVYIREIGSQSYLRARYGLDVESIAKNILEEYKTL